MRQGRLKPANSGSDPGLRQDAEPLVVHHVAETPPALLNGPADEAVSDPDLERRRSPADQCDPAAVDLGDLADHRTEEPTFQPVVLVEERVEPGELGAHARTHDQSVTALEALLHAAVATTSPGRSANPGVESQVRVLNGGSRYTSFTLPRYSAANSGSCARLVSAFSLDPPTSLSTPAR